MVSTCTPTPCEVLGDLSFSGREPESIKLVKPFKGMLLNQDVLVLDTTPNSATFKATNLKMYAALEGQIYLHSQVFPKPMAAHILDLNYGKGTLVVSDFTYIEGEWKERQCERVRVKDPTYISVCWRQMKIRASLENISAIGMGILAYKPEERGLRLQTGSRVQIDFQLSPHSNMAGLKGRVVYVQPVDGSLVKLGIRLHPNALEARSLESYVTRRKVEILEELTQAYYETRRPRRVERLYF